MLEAGRYTIIYKGGDYRTLQVKEGKNAFAGKTIVSMKEGNRFTGFGFLVDPNTIKFWRRFSAVNPPERLKRIQHAIDLIATDPSAAQQAYAMKEGKCARCGRDLTVPASLHRGLGPECANKGRWAKKDNAAVFDWLKAEQGRESEPDAA
jgi:hypothetical protein